MWAVSWKWEQFWSYSKKLLPCKWYYSQMDDFMCSMQTVLYYSGNSITLKWIILCVLCKSYYITVGNSITLRWMILCVFCKYYYITVEYLYVLLPLVHDRLAGVWGGNHSSSQILQEAIICTCLVGASGEDFWVLCYWKKLVVNIWLVFQEDCWVLCYWKKFVVNVCLVFQEDFWVLCAAGEISSSCKLNV